jgi:AraC-like DNA-binding protein
MRKTLLSFSVERAAQSGMDDTGRRRARVATVQVRNFLGLKDVLADLGVDPSEALRTVGLPTDLFSDPGRTLLYADAARLWAHVIRLTNCDDLGLRIGQRQTATAIGLTGLVSMNSATVGEALQTIASGLKMSDTGGSMTFRVRNGVAFAGYAVTAQDIDIADQIADCALAILTNAMRQFCGSTWRPDRVHLTRDPPRDTRRHALFFKAPIDFRARASEISFAASVLNLSVNNRDAMSREILGSLFDAALVEADNDFVFALKSVLRSQIGAGRLTRKSVARAMGLNEQALIGRLRTFNLTFAGLADEARFDTAQGLLLRDKEIAEIAANLGFADASGFTKAFRKWSGTTPARWRATRNGAPPGLYRARAI